MNKTYTVCQNEDWHVYAIHNDDTKSYSNIGEVFGEVLSVSANADATAMEFIREAEARGDLIRTVKPPQFEDKDLYYRIVDTDKWYSTTVKCVDRI